MIQQSLKIFRAMIRLNREVNSNYYTCFLKKLVYKKLEAGASKK